STTHDSPVATEARDARASERTAPPIIMDDPSPLDVPAPRMAPAAPPAPMASMANPAKMYTVSPPTNTERYAEVEDNPVQRASEQPVSTFSVDVDTGSYSNVRRMLVDGIRPPANAV